MGALANRRRLPGALLACLTGCASTAGDRPAPTRSRDAIAVAPDAFRGPDAPGPPDAPPVPPVDVPARCRGAACGCAGLACCGGPAGDCDGWSECRDGICVACPGNEVVCSGRCTDLQRDLRHCGRCGQVCERYYCSVAVSCGDACPRDRADCDGDCANGCETDTRDDACNCGGCGHDCTAYPGVADARCDGCTCRIVACAAGLGDCDGIPGTGCEVALAVDPGHCGACGRSCRPDQRCHAGSCGCPEGRVECGGRCVDPLRDAAHCGGCGNACPSGHVCSAGRCAARCEAPGESQCGGECVSLDSDPRNCGGCGRRCAFGACVGGACDPRCSGGATRCGHACVDLGSNFYHCGSCGVRCALGTRCLGGHCVASPSCLTATR